MRFSKSLILGIAVNIFFCLLPVYDTVNIFTALNLGALSFHNAYPVFMKTTNPSGFFISMYLVPVGIVYTFTQSVYLSAMIAKLLLLLFFLMFAIILLRLFDFYEINSNQRKLIELLIFLNPSIILINFIWAELVIIPAFFVTFSYYVLRAKPLNKDYLNMSIAILSLWIAILFFLYPLVLIPTYLIYTKHRRNKLILLLYIFIIGTVFIFLQIIVFNGHLFNYVLSLTGNSSTLSVTSLRSGLFYYLGIGGTARIVVEITLVITISIVVPLLMKFKKYDEKRTLFIVMIFFLYVSTQVDMDNFLFLLPFIFLALIGNNGKLISVRSLILVNFVLLVPVFFAPIYYYHNLVYALFYWTYPLTHLLGPTVPWLSENEVVLPLYNFVFSISVFISSLLILGKRDPNHEKRRVKSSSLSLQPIEKKTLKLIAIVVVLILVPVPFAMSYNNYNNNININNPSTFPLLYFYPEYSPHSSIAVSIGQPNYSYSTHGSTLIIPSSTPNLLLKKNLSSTELNLTALINVGNPTRDNLTLAWSNNWELRVLPFSNISTLLILINGVKRSSFNYVGNFSIAVSLVTNMENTKLSVNNQSYTLGKDNFLYLGKNGSSNSQVDITIYNLVLKSELDYGFYMVAPFLAFYYPIIFTFISVIFTGPKYSRFEQNIKYHCSEFQ